MVASIAYQQWRVARNKLRLDLFDRRYKVYESTRKFLSVIFREARFEDSDLFTFFAGTSDAEFLFDSSVVKYLDQIRNRALDMRTHQKKYELMPVGEERSKHIEAELIELNWLTSQLREMSKVFVPYLGFAHVR